MDYNSLMEELGRKKYHPVYFLMGEEDYFTDMVSDYIEQNVLDESEREFNQTVLYGRDVTINDVLGAARRFPMMSEHQVVIVKEAQEIKDIAGVSTKEKDKSKQKGLLEAYLENPLRSTILVFCYKHKSFDKRTSLFKVLDKHAVVLESKRMYDNKVPDFINNYLKTRKYTINPRAAAMLAEYLGTSLSKITNELDKLIINIPPGTEISGDHIQRNIGISKEYNVFELQNALSNKDVLKANRIINYFAANPGDNNLIPILGALYSHFVKIMVYHFHTDKKTVAAAMGVSPYFVKDYERAAQSFNVGKLKAIFGFLRDYDLRAKGVNQGTATHGELLKELVFKILH